MRIKSAPFVYYAALLVALNDAFASAFEDGALPLTLHSAGDKKAPLPWRRQQPLRNETKTPESLKSMSKDAFASTLSISAAVMAESSVVPSLAMPRSSSSSDELKATSSALDQADRTSSTRSSDQTSSKLASSKEEPFTSSVVPAQTLPEITSSPSIPSLSHMTTVDRTSNALPSTTSTDTTIASSLPIVASSHKSFSDASSSKTLNGPTMSITSSTSTSSDLSTPIRSLKATSSFVSTSTATFSTISSSTPMSNVLSATTKSYSLTSTASSKTASSDILSSSLTTSVTTLNDLSKFNSLSTAATGSSSVPPASSLSIFVPTTDGFSTSSVSFMTISSHASSTNEESITIKSPNVESTGSTSQPTGSRLTDRSRSSLSTSSENVPSSASLTLISSWSTAAASTNSSQLQTSTSRIVDSVVTSSNQPPTSTVSDSSTITRSRPLASVTISLPISNRPLIESMPTSTASSSGSLLGSSAPVPAVTSATQSMAFIVLPSNSNFSASSSALLSNSLPLETISSFSILSSTDQSSYSQTTVSPNPHTVSSAVESVTRISLNQTTFLLSSSSFAAPATAHSDTTTAPTHVSIVQSTDTSTFNSSAAVSSRISPQTSSIFFSSANTLSSIPTVKALPTNSFTSGNWTQSQALRTSSLPYSTGSLSESAPSADVVQTISTSATVPDSIVTPPSSITTSQEGILFDSLTTSQHVGNGATRIATGTSSSSATSSPTRTPVVPPLTQSQRAGVAVGSTAGVLLAVVLVVFVARRLYSNQAERRKSTGSIYPKSAQLYDPVRAGRGGDDEDGGASALMSGGAGGFSPKPPQNTPDPGQRSSTGPMNRYSDPGNPFRDPEDPFKDLGNLGRDVHNAPTDSVPIPQDAAAAFAAAVDGYAVVSQKSPVMSEIPTSRHLHNLSFPSPALSPYGANQNTYHGHVRSPGLQPNYYQPSMRDVTANSRADEPFEYDLLLGVVSQTETPDSVLVYAPPPTPLRNRPDSSISTVSHPERFSLAYDMQSSTTYLRAAPRGPSSPGPPNNPSNSPMPSPPPVTARPTNVGWSDIKRSSSVRRTPSPVNLSPPPPLSPLPLSFPSPPSNKRSLLQLRRKEPALAGQGQAMAPSSGQPLTVKVPFKYDQSTTFQAPKMALLEKLSHLDEKHENSRVSPTTASVYSRDSMEQHKTNAAVPVTSARVPSGTFF